MINLFKNTAKHSAIYSIGNIGVKVIGLILLPMYTHHLSTADYGTLGVLEATSQLLINVFGFRLSTAMMRWYNDVKGPQAKGSLIFTSIFSTVLILLLFNAATLPFTSQFSQLFFKSEEFKIYFLILIISSSFEILNKLYYDFLRIRTQSILYVVVIAIKLSLVLGLNIYFVAYRKLGVEGIILSQLIGNSITLFVFSLATLKHLVFKYDYQLFKKLFRYGFPLIFSSISALLLSLGDRYIIIYFVGYDDLGLYSLAYKIAGVINLILLQSFQMGFTPIAFQMFNSENGDRYFSKVLTYFTFLLVIFSLGLVIYSSEVIKFFTEQNYWNAISYVPFLVIAFIFKGIQYVFAFGLHKVKKTQYNAIIISISLVVNIGLNFVLIPIYGAIGAAYSTVFSSLLLCVLFYWFSQRFYQIPYELKKVALMLIIGVLLYLGATLLSEVNLIPRILLKLGLVLSFPFLLIPFKFYEAIEIERIRGFLKKWKSLQSWRENLGKIKLR